MRKHTGNKQKATKARCCTHRKACLRTGSLNIHLGVKHCTVTAQLTLGTPRLRGCTSSIFEGGVHGSFLHLRPRHGMKAAVLLRRSEFWGPIAVSSGFRLSDPSALGRAVWPGPTHALWRTASSSCPARRPGPRRRPPRPPRTARAQRRGGGDQRPAGPGPFPVPPARGWAVDPGKGSPSGSHRHILLLIRHGCPAARNSLRGPAPPRGPAEQRRAGWAALPGLPGPRAPRCCRGIALGTVPKPGQDTHWIARSG